MKNRKYTERIGLWISLGSILVVIGIVSFLSQNWLNARLDLTEEKRFSLNPSTKKLIHSLEETLIIKCVFSKDLPNQFTQIKNSITDFLEDLKSISKSKVQIIFIDPEDDAEKIQEVRSLGIQQVQLQSQTSQSLEIKKGYFGIAMIYGEQNQSIPVITNASFFEYDVILRLKKLLGQLKTVGIVQGQEGQYYSPSLLPKKASASSFEENFSNLYNQLQNFYFVKMLDLEKDSFDLSDSIDVLLVVGPKKLTKKEQKRIDHFLNQSGSVLSFVPRIFVKNERGLVGEWLNYNYEPWLAHYGFSVKKEILMDSRYFNKINFSNSIFPTPYPYWIVIPAEHLNKTSIITKKLPSISFPWTSFLDLGFLLQNQNHPNVKNTVLANSSSYSWSTSDIQNLLPKEKYNSTTRETKVLSILREGQFDPFFKDSSKISQSLAEPSRLMVISNLYFISDFYLKVSQNRRNSNISFVTNAVDKLASDEDLISLRNRYISPRNINEFGKSNKNILIIINLLAVPIILILIGIIVGIRLRRKTFN